MKKRMYYQKIKYSLFLFLLCFAGVQILAQTDPPPTDTTEEGMDIYEHDSLLSVQLDEMISLYQQADSLHTQDSIKIANILEKLEDLQTLDNLKKDELVQQLEGIQSADSLHRVLHKQRIARLRSISKGFPVVPFIDTVFYVYSKIGSFTPSIRAKNIAKRLQSLEGNLLFQPDSLNIEQSADGLTTDIIAGDIIVMSITADDALWLNMSQQEMAEKNLQAIKIAILAERKRHSLQSILSRVGLIALILMGLLLIIFLINRLFRFFKKRSEKLKGSWIKGIKIRDYQLLNPDQQVQATHSVLNFIRLTVILLAMYITLPLIFSVFPWTKGIATTLFGYIVNPAKSIVNSIISYLPNLLTIGVIYIFFHYTIQFLKFLTKEIEIEVLRIPGFYPDWAQPTFIIIRFLLYAFMFIMIFPYLPGSDSPIFQGVSVFLGVLFSLGSSSTISNIISGLVLTYMRPYQVGDRIQIGEVVGDVIEKSMLVTRIRTVKNENLTIPNSNVLNGKTINFSASAKDPGLILQTTVTIGYDVEWETVERLLVDAALVVEGIVKDKAPFVWQSSLDDFYVSYTLNAYTNKPDRMYELYSEIHKNIQNNFNHLNIEILSPHFESSHDGSKMFIPQKYKKQPTNNKPLQ